MTELVLGLGTALGQRLNGWVGRWTASENGELMLEWPLVLLLLPLPLLALLLPAATTWRPALHVPFYQDLRSLSSASSGLAAQRWILPSLIWLLLLFSASRPVWLGEAVQLPTQGRDMMIAVDISGSMDIADMKTGNKWTRRIQVVKQVVGEFVSRRQGDRMGLILFGSLPYLQAPLSFDLHTIGTLLTEAQLGFAGEKTAIGDAVALAVKRLRERPTESRILLLLTDGRNNTGSFDPAQAAQLAELETVKIYTIGIGAERMPQRSFFGRTRMVRNEELDENSLRRIARISGGRYFRARDPQELEQIYRTLDELEPVDQDAESFRPQTPRFHQPLAVALLLSFAYCSWLTLLRPRLFGG